MSFVISSALPFPNIYWFKQVVQAGSVLWDGKEHFEKMSYRNRYYIATASGALTLSIPIEQGRDQRAVMEDINISYREDWQKQHWRTIVSAYGRSPYFSHYEPELEPLFTTRYEKLYNYNLATIHWLLKQLRVSLEEHTTDSYQKKYEGAVADLRLLKPKDEITAAAFKPYTQVFADRTGFLTNMSMLDLLFSEGPYALQYLNNNA